MKEQKKNSKIDELPTNFKELIESKEGFKLFSNYVSDNFGTNLIQCFNDLIYYKNNQQEIEEEILNLYCKKDSNKCCIYDPDFRLKIMNEKGKPIENWYKTLYDHIYRILSLEYCPRFINSNTWREFLNLNFIKEETLKFNDLYTIKSIDKRKSFFSEKFEILSVSNILTSDIFKSKRIMSTKLNIETQYIKVFKKKFFVFFF